MTIDYDTKTAGIPSGASITESMRRSTTAETREMASIAPVLGQANAVCAQLEDAIATVIAAWNAFKQPMKEDAGTARPEGYPVPTDRIEAISDRLTAMSNQTQVLHALAQDIRSRT